MQKSSRQGQLRLAVGRCAFAGAALAAAPGQAADLDTGNSDVVLRFDNTVKASTIYRLHDADPSLVNTFNANGSPQALNFNAGRNRVCRPDRARTAGRSAATPRRRCGSFDRLR